MRRLTGGLLAAALLVTAGCGSQDTTNDASEVTVAESPVLAAASSPSEPLAPQTGSFTALVVSPEGIASPGLDAVVNTLLARPDTGVEVVVPAAADVAALETRASSALGLIATETMTGYPASAVNGTTADAIAAAFDGTRPRPDLVIVGIVDDAPVGAAIESSHAVAIARMVNGYGVPVLVVATRGDDIAGTAMALTTILDYELGYIVDHGGVFVLTVPTCPASTVRGPIVVEVGRGDVPDTINCDEYADAEPSTDTAGFGAGFVTLTDIS